MKINTIKIKSDNSQGFIVINESDFNTSEHTEYDPDKVVKKTTTRKAPVKKR